MHSRMSNYAILQLQAAQYAWQIPSAMSINKYFSPGTPAKQMEDTIIKALEMYRKRERNKDQERER